MKIFFNNRGFLLMDALVGVIILSVTLLSCMTMYGYIAKSHQNSNLYIAALNQFELRLYSGKPTETIEINGREVTFKQDLLTYCVVYKD